MPKATKRKVSRPTAQPMQGARRERQERGREVRRAADERQRRMPLFRLLALVAGAVVVALVAVYLLTTQSSQPSYGARLVADQGRDHVAPGQAHPAYNSSPPTSGWHYESEAAWGIHDQPVADEAQVHNLEHGGIVVQYWCPDGCPELATTLKGVVSRYRAKVLLAPYGKPLPNRIALTAWRWIDTFDDFDEQRVVSFIEAHKDRGPEQVPD